MRTKAQSRFIDELVYRHAKSFLYIRELAIVEQDIAAELGNALGRSETSREDAAAIVRARMNRVWSRLEAEWNQLRSDPTAAIGVFDPECPACVALSNGAGN